MVIIPQLIFCLPNLFVPLADRGGGGSYHSHDAGADWTKPLPRDERLEAYV